MSIITLPDYKIPPGHKGYAQTIWQFKSKAVFFTWVAEGTILLEIYWSKSWHLIDSGLSCSSYEHFSTGLSRCAVITIWVDFLLLPKSPTRQDEMLQSDKWAPSRFNWLTPERSNSAMEDGGTLKCSLMGNVWVTINSLALLSSVLYSLVPNQVDTKSLIFFL